MDICDTQGRQNNIHTGFLACCAYQFPYEIILIASGKYWFWIQQNLDEQCEEEMPVSQINLRAAVLGGNENLVGESKANE